ncbi:MAG: YeeE/YedE family protein [Boseongicola sp. SB0675_bin_26]|nr:YeeE/YedE family protein [Boseongicola sp. SB0675_bin_26]
MLGVLIGLPFGVAAQLSRFCLRRSVVEFTVGQFPAFGVWLMAFLVALLGTQALILEGQTSFVEHRFHASALPILTVLVGGALFGTGMVLTRGCISRLTVLSATGNLRAAICIAVFAIVAHAALKGVLAPLRLGLGAVMLEVGEFANLGNLPGGTGLWVAIALVALAAVIYRSGARLVHLLLGAAIGMLVPLGWFGTGVFLQDAFDPIPMASISFTAPWADTLFWSVASTSIAAGFGTGLVGGTLVGSFLSAASRGELALQSFEAPGQTMRYLFGAAMMGLGGVLAGGCTVGAGLAGTASLSLSAVLALVAMIASAWLANRFIDGRPARLRHSEPDR